MPQTARQRPTWYAAAAATCCKNLHCSFIFPIPFISAAAAHSPTLSKQGSSAHPSDQRIYSGEQRVREGYGSRGRDLRLGEHGWRAAHIDSSLSSYEQRIRWLVDLRDTDSDSEESETEGRTDQSGFTDEPASFLEVESSPATK